MRGEVEIKIVATRYAYFKTKMPKLNSGLLYVAATPGNFTALSRLLAGFKGTYLPGLRRHRKGKKTGLGGDSVWPRSGSAYVFMRIYATAWVATTVRKAMVIILPFLELVHCSLMTVTCGRAKLGTLVYYLLLSLRCFNANYRCAMSR